MATTLPADEPGPCGRTLVELLGGGVLVWWVVGGGGGSAVLELLVPELLVLELLELLVLVLVGLDELGVLEERTELTDVRVVVRVDGVVVRAGAGFVAGALLAVVVRCVLVDEALAAEALAAGLSPGTVTCGPDGVTATVADVLPLVTGVDWPDDGFAALPWPQAATRVSAVPATIAAATRRPVRCARVPDPSGAVIGPMCQPGRPAGRRHDDRAGLDRDPMPGGHYPRPGASCAVRAGTGPPNGRAGHRTSRECGMQPGMPDLRSIVLRAQQMQADMERAQAALASAEITGHAGGGVVTATVTGDGQLLRVVIDPSVVDPADVETLGDLVVAAVRDATRQAAELSQDAMGSVTDDLAGGFDLSALGIPGFGSTVDADENPMATPDGPDGLADGAGGPDSDGPHGPDPHGPDSHGPDSLDPDSDGDTDFPAVAPRRQLPETPAGA